MTADCTYCGGVLSGSSQAGSFDEVLASGPAVVLAPSVGALVPGHMLVISTEHVTSLAALGRRPLSVLQRWVSQLDACLRNATDEPALFFEHGSGALTGGGACIDHAHLHVFPALADLAGPIASELGAQRLARLEDLSGSENRNYALIGSREGWRVLLDANLPSQWIRRRVATHLGHPNEYDWAVFVGNDLLPATLALGRQARRCLDAMNAN